MTAQQIQSTPTMPPHFSRQIPYKALEYLTSGTCDTVDHHIDTGILNRMGLNTGISNGEHYPLTHQEQQFIAEDYVALGSHMALIGYSGLLGSDKYLLPTIEIDFGENSYDSYTYEQADEIACAALEGLQATCEETGGFFASDELAFLDHLGGGRITLVLAIPMSYALNNATTHDEWKTHLEALGQRHFNSIAR